MAGTDSSPERESTVTGIDRDGIDRHGIDRNRIDQNVIEQTVRINARPATVWKYWTDPERLLDWWGAAAELEPLPGGLFRVEMPSGPIMVGEYLELVPYERLVFSFGWEPAENVPAIAPGSSTVEVTLIEEAGDTILTLRHSGIPIGLGDVHSVGWVSAAERLAAAVASASDDAVTPADPTP